MPGANVVLRQLAVLWKFFVITMLGTADVLVIQQESDVRHGGKETSPRNQSWYKNYDQVLCFSFNK